MRKLDLSGQRFGKLVAYKEAGHNKEGRTMWQCKCDCGGEKTATTHDLRCGNTRSCGCIQREISSWKFGIPHKKLTHVYNGMKRRCYSKTEKNYEDYGGRGIKICDEWMGENGREKFVVWALENGYREGLTIERINVDGDYSPDNCCWIEHALQAKNKRNTIHVEYNGITMCLKDAARASGMSWGTLYQRVKNGWPNEHLFDAPYKAGRKIVWETSIS